MRNKLRKVLHRESPDGRAVNGDEPVACEQLAVGLRAFVDANHRHWVLPVVGRLDSDPELHPAGTAERHRAPCGHLVPSTCNDQRDLGHVLLHNADHVGELFPDHAHAVYREDQLAYVDHARSLLVRIDAQHNHWRKGRICAADPDAELLAPGPLENDLARRIFQLLQEARFSLGSSFFFCFAHRGLKLSLLRADCNSSGGIFSVLRPCSLDRGCIHRSGRCFWLGWPWGE